ncbi:thioredoxin family protein [Halorubrum lacusprofundi]|jgi:thioredoxin-like negative regulator of GroEL|uniref:Thioredoxin domain protein n=1 Tax=Halorubrum lacusprofundi (strain ATCC 49239 / DSM 5036 / JCM 8891 / ACAM 34) TaxID=416348 RepID=B9LSH1_HALLT|nr:thioredoxin family protein [Halorubrum lacusprofundi]ACM57918.1 Thioredoxin domain protein [Halorubrum lacusprofundi ATCC 49239]MCG1006928.1 thioredoxin family protein [Halorubrum lacusprofundi]
MKNNTESGASEPADDVSGSSTSTEVRRPVSLADEDALDAFVADADAAVIEFYTDGCGICASMEPVLGNVARELDLAVATVNPRDDPPLVERFDVRSVPLFVLFVDGEPVARRAEGFIPGDDLTAWITDHVA